MSANDRAVVAITGANGLVGGIASDAFRAAGYTVRRLVRCPRPGTDDRRFALESGASIGDLQDADVLVHCAYDMSVTSRRDVWRSNVFGTRRLLDMAAHANVRRTILVSSMSAFVGTHQIYGRAKLACETHAFVHGMVSVRLGLVYGPRWGGMAGALRRLAALPIVPVVARSAHQFTLHEDDLGPGLIALAEAQTVGSTPLGLAHSSPVKFEQLIRSLSGLAGAHQLFVPVPWRPTYLCLRAAELAHLPSPVRADSLLGLVHAPNALPGQSDVRALGLNFRPYSMDVVAPPHRDSPRDSGP